MTSAVRGSASGGFKCFTSLKWWFVPQTRLRCKTTLVWLCYHCGLPHYKHIMLHTLVWKWDRSANTIYTGSEQSARQESLNGNSRLLDMVPVFSLKGLPGVILSLIQFHSQHPESRRFLFVPKSNTAELKGSPEVDRRWNSCFRQQQQMIQQIINIISVMENLLLKTQTKK